MDRSSLADAVAAQAEIPIQEAQDEPIVVATRSWLHSESQSMPWVVVIRVVRSVAARSEFFCLYFSKS